MSSPEHESLDAPSASGNDDDDDAFSSFDNDEMTTPL